MATTKQYGNTSVTDEGNGSYTVANGNTKSNMQANDFSRLLASGSFGDSTTNAQIMSDYNLKPYVAPTPQARDASGNLIAIDPNNPTPVANQLSAVSGNQGTTTPPVDHTYQTPNISGQLSAIPQTSNSSSTSSDSLVGNSTSGSQYSPGQVGASLGNIAQQTPQDAQRQALKTDPNNITGYQNTNPLSS